MTTNNTENAMGGVTITDLDGMIEVYAECHAFVTGQAEGEWGDELIANDARKLALFVHRHRIAARQAALEEGQQSWDGLARAIMTGFDCDCRTPSKLFKHLIQSGHEIPDWMREEHELQFADHVISKGTRCVLIYRAMTEHLRTLSTKEVEG